MCLHDAQTEYVTHAFGHLHRPPASPCFSPTSPSSWLGFCMMTNEACSLDVSPMQGLHQAGPHTRPVDRPYQAPNSRRAPFTRLDPHARRVSIALYDPMHLQKSTNLACHPCLRMMRSHHLNDLLPLTALNPTLSGPSLSQSRAPCWTTPSCTSFPCIRVPSQLPRTPIFQP